MAYIFYDFEFANCFDGEKKICSFGYVLTDEQFNILEKEDLLINPHSRFDYYALKKVMHKKASDFLDKPDFRDYYDKIVNLLTKNISFGFSVSNETTALSDEMYRFKLPFKLITSYDIPDFYKYIGFEPTKMSLTNIANQLDIDISFLSSHTSSDDAHITMLILKKIVSDSKISFSKMLNQSKKLFKTRDKSIMPYEDYSVNPNLKNNLRNKLKKLFQKYPLYERKICLSDAFCLSDNELLKLVEVFLDNGYGYTKNPSKAFYYIIANEASKKDAIAKKADLKIIEKGDLELIINHKLQDNLALK